MGNELSVRLDETVKNILIDVQSYSHANSIEKRDPERWIKLAKSILQGVPVNELKKTNQDWGTIARVRAQLAESPACSDLKRELSVRQIQALETTSELRKTAAEMLAKKMGNQDEWDKIDLEQAGRLYDKLTIAEDIDTKTLMRLRGENVQRIEITKKEVSFEDMLNEVKKQRDANVEAIDVDSEDI